jgi:flagellar basal-body rod protein FlgB
MWIDRLLNSPVRHGLHLTARFAEDQHRVLSENLANIDTPDYRAKQLDGRRFQAELRGAFERARERQQAPRSGQGLELRGGAPYSTDADGRLVTTPVEGGADNVLFQDGTNASIEQLVTQVHENALTYRFAMTRLRGKFDSLMTAIKGRVS